MSLRKEVENYSRCSFWSLCKTFGDIKTVKKKPLYVQIFDSDVKKSSQFFKTVSCSVGLGPSAVNDRVLHGDFLVAGLLVLAPLHLALTEFSRVSESVPALF